MPVTGWMLDRKEREALLERFPPEWPDVIADHITLDANADLKDPLPEAEQAAIVGGINDGEGLQAMVVAVDGSTDRPDGSTYHITWSLDRSRGRKPVQSNAVIATRGWRPLDDPVPIKIRPARWQPMQLYLDCDGVLADFDRAASELLRMSPRAFEQRHGIGAFWREIARHPDFYGTLPLMPDAMLLFEAVRHLDPIILTGLPRGKWAAPQKVRWAAEHFPGTRILTVMAVDKRNHAREGDILVDDQLKHAHLWEGAGGIFVHHRDAESTIVRLAELGVPVREIDQHQKLAASRTGGAHG